VTFKAPAKSMPNKSTNMTYKAEAVFIMESKGSLLGWSEIRTILTTKATAHIKLDRAKRVRSRIKVAKAISLTTGKEIVMHLKMKRLFTYTREKGILKNSRKTLNINPMKKVFIIVLQGKWNQCHFISQRSFLLILKVARIRSWLKICSNDLLKRHKHMNSW